MAKQAQFGTVNQSTTGPAAAKTISGIINFSQFASLCETISKREQKKKKEPLKSFIESWRKEYKKLYPTNPQPPIETFLPVISLLMPDRDLDRIYGMKEVALARLLIEEMGLNVSGDAAQMLIHWKSRKPQGASTMEVSDFAGVAYFVLQTRIRKQEEITIEEVNQILDGLAEANTCGGAERKTQSRTLIHSVFTRMNESEMKWFIRIILKDMKMGIGYERMLECYHPDAADLYDVCNSLSKVCLTLNDPEVRMSEVEVSLFSFVRPMLSDGWKPDKLRALLKTKGTLLAEIKYDGERVQIHKKGNKYMYFSRGCKDISEDLGARPDEGNLTRYIADCFRPDATNFIIDGEICPYSIQEKCIATKAESMAIKNLTGETGYQVCFVAFDCLLYNDKTLTAQPLTARLEVLKKLFQEEEGRLYQAARINVTTPDECYDFLNEAIDRDEEGIILKDPGTVYKPNKRDAGWWKVKPEYVDSLSDQLDVLVVGGYYGTGRRSGPSHFMCAVAEPPATPGAHPTKFLSLCKVGSGYTMAELQEINQKLDKHWKKWNANAKPAFLQLAPGGKTPDLWVEPEHSFIVKIGAAQLLDSDSFASGCTLRFPRMKEARMDKPWYDCMTTTQLQALKEESRGRLGARNVTDDILTTEGNPRKKAKTNNRAAVLRVAAEYRPADVHDVEVTGSVFVGKEFYIAGDGPDHSKQDLERLVVEHGGRCVQHPSSRTFCVISQKRTVHVANVFKQSPVDVVLPAWLIRCTKEGAFLPWPPEDVLFATEKTKKMITSAFDQYGDSFTAPITEADFERNLREMDKLKLVDKDRIVQFEEEHLQDFPLMGLFRLCVAYVDKFEIVGVPESKSECEGNLALAVAYVKAFGGKVSPEISDDVTHVIVHSPGPLTRLEELKRINHRRKAKFHLVTERWVLESVEATNMREERGYIPRLPTSDTKSRLSVFTGLFDDH